VGLNGVAGYKLRVSPGKKQLELYRGDVVKQAVPLQWHAGSWTHLKLSLVKSGDKEWKLEGWIWRENEKQPEKPSISFTDTETPPSGCALVTGSPYSATPIRFDNFVVSAITP
jgi:hypothetical protein